MSLHIHINNYTCVKNLRWIIWVKKDLGFFFFLFMKNDGGDILYCNCIYVDESVSDYYFYFHFSCCNMHQWQIMMVSVFYL
jgi:hypothetical protein